jgi:predicted porin
LNKKVLTTALLATFAGAAHAQSSVTLYGIIDAGISYVNHSGSASQKLFKYDDGVAQGSRWGMRGTEDLGGGLKAIFVLEGGFNSGNGTASQGGALFGRQAFVGLSKDNIGSVTFGRQYSLSTDVLGGSYSNGGNTVAGNYAYHMSDIDQLTSSRINNSVKFSSANFYGFTFGALYGFSNQAGSFGGSPSVPTSPTASTPGSSRTFSFGANYAYGPFGLGAAYTDIKFPAQSTPAFPTTLANFGTSATSGVASIRDLRTFGVGTRYTFGPATLWALYTNTNIQPITLGATTFSAYDAGAKYAFTQALSLALGYSYMHLSGATTGHWNQLNAALDYALSKRTDVYFLTVYQDASGKVGTQDLQASIGDSSSFFGNSGSNATNQLALRVGLRHKF